MWGSCSKPKGHSPLHGPLPWLSWLWGPKPPCFTNHCARCCCLGGDSTGLSWQWSLGGPLPAESTNSVPVHQPSSFLTSLSPLSGNSAGVVRSSRLLGLQLPFPIQHRSRQCLFLSCPCRCQGPGSAASDHGEEGETQDRSSWSLPHPYHPSPPPITETFKPPSGPPGPSLCKGVRSPTFSSSSAPQTLCWSGLMLLHSCMDFPEPGFPSQGHGTLIAL